MIINARPTGVAITATQNSTDVFVSSPWSPRLLGRRRRWRAARGGCAHRDGAPGATSVVPRRMARFGLRHRRDCRAGVEVRRRRRPAVESVTGNSTSGRRHRAARSRPPARARERDLEPVLTGELGGEAVDELQRLVDVVTEHAVGGGRSGASAGTTSVGAPPTAATSWSVSAVGSSANRTIVSRERSRSTRLLPEGLDRAGGACGGGVAQRRQQRRTVVGGSNWRNGDVVVAVRGVCRARRRAPARPRRRARRSKVAVGTVLPVSRITSTESDVGAIAAVVTTRR